jgi:competence protein ComEA
MKRIIKDYLYFSKQERIAVMLLLALMAAFMLLPYLYKPAFEPPVINQALTDWLANNNDSSSGETAMVKNVTSVPASLFVFDPNTAAENDWQRLGVSAKTARTIINYRSKGGKFRKPDDIRKIWGLSNADAERLLPYVRIAGTETVAKTTFSESATRQPSVNRQPAIIDINTADLSAWAALPGVGDALANRITRYREKIGGFRSVEQVAKTYGISDSLFRNILPYLRLDTGNLPKLDLNTASAYALTQAGIDQRFARELVRYREQHGPYHSLDELHKMVEMPDSAWQKLVIRIKIE